MSISWRTDYAMRIMYELAKRGEGARASVSVLAKDASVPYDFARRIANHLAHAGLLESRRGARGGFALTASPDVITLLDVFDAMDERATLALCTLNEAGCSREGFCPFHHGLWSRMDALIASELAATSLTDAVKAGMAFMPAAAH